MVAGIDAVAWEVRGDDGAPAVLLVPPLGRSRSSWDSQTPALVEEFRCVVFDPRGIGASKGTAAGPYTVETIAVDAVGVLDRAGLDRVHVVGWSFGAIPAAQLTVDNPNRVASLSLLTPWARTDEHLATAFRMLRDLTVYASTVAAEVGTLWLILSPEAVNAAGPQLVEGARAAVADPGYPEPEVMTGYLDAAIGVDVLDRLSALSVPTLVIGGARDVLVPVAHAHQTAATVPGARLQVLEGAGASHALPVERADEVNELLRKFIDAHPLRDDRTVPERSTP
jgi:3-oxoadipate enol-lactonase